MKKIISMILCVLMVVSMLPMSAFALDLPELDVIQDVVAAVEEEEVTESVEEVPAEEEVEEPAEETEPESESEPKVVEPAEEVEPEQEPEAEVEDPIEPTEEESEAEEESVEEESSESAFGVMSEDVTESAPTLNSSFEASGVGLADFANTLVGKKMSDFPSAHQYSNDWCCWFVNYCAYSVGLSSSKQGTADKLFPAFADRVFMQASDGWAATNQRSFARWIVNHGVGTLYYANLPSSIPGTPTGISASIDTSSVYCKKTNLSTFIPQKGDLVFMYDWGHIAIVYSYDASSGQITLIGGNESGSGWSNSKVQKRQMAKDSSDICAYARPSYGYISECTYYPSYLMVEIISEEEIETEPREDAENLGVTAKVGKTYTVIGTYENTYGSYWYAVDVNGTTGYIWAPRAEVLYCMYDDDITISGVSAPNEITKGNSFSIKGTIKSTYNTITSVQGHILDSTGKVLYTKDAAVNSKSYSLYNSEVDYALKFNELSTGTYRYIIGATVTNYYYSNDSKKLTYEKPSLLMVDEYFTVVSAGHTHSYTKKIVSPTCEAQGYTQYTCSCGASYKDNYTNATGHSYSSKVTQVATCTKSGVVTYTCSSCGDSYESTTSPTGHSYISETIGGNCVEPATTVYTCEVCGDSYSEVADNNWSEWSTTYPSGVDSDAIESRVEYRYKVKEHTTSTSSSLSGWDLEDEVSEWGDYGAWSSWSTTKATASDSKQVETRTAYHYYYYKCASCGAHMHGYGTNACYTWAGGCGGTIKSSSYTKGYYATPYSSAKDWHGTGVYYITDSSAGKVFAYTSSSSSHYVAPVTQYRYRTRALETTYYFYRWGNWSDWSATYVAASDDTKVETRTVYRYDLYSMAEHDWDSGVVTTPAGPGTSGVKTYTCNVCGETKTESIAALPNEYTVTYNANGGTGAPAAQSKTHGEDLTLSTTKPTRSGYTFLGWSTVKTAEIAMFEPGKTYSLADKDLVLYAVWEHSDHSYMESITKQPTCTSTGVKTYTCSVCGDSYEETLNATDHKTELLNAAEATCTKGGYTGDLYCTVCKTTVSYGQEVAASGHKEVTDAAVAATCTKTGLTEGSHCSVCGTVTVAQKTVAKIAHTWDSGKVTKEPALNVDGVLTYTCTACGGTKTEKISAISVDINSDGTSNAFDLVALMKHIVGAETAKNTDALDVNGDNKVDILDVVRLVRYLA